MLANIISASDLPLDEVYPANRSLFSIKMQTNGFLNQILSNNYLIYLIFIAIEFNLL